MDSCARTVFVKYVCTYNLILVHHELLFFICKKGGQCWCTVRCGQRKGPLLQTDEISGQYWPPALLFCQPAYKFYWTV